MATLGWQEAPNPANPIAMKRFLDDLVALIRDYQTIGAGIIVRSGSGTPEGVVTANVGSLFLRTDSSSTLYVKQTGDNTNTGWVAK